jgi:hypothetical protein
MIRNMIVKKEESSGRKNGALCAGTGGRRPRK